MMKLTDKQREVFDCFKIERPIITICSGAKRAGKTYVLILIYLAHIARFEDKGLSFIIGGATQASIRRNVLDDMERILGKELKLDKTNAVEIFGNKVYCFDGENANAWKKVRGFTAAGAFLNEATALHDSFVKECISRCSYEGARVIMDTNPENPMHTVKVDYIDKSGQRLKNGQLNVQAFHFTLFDNDTLPKEYIESIVNSTPSGMFTDRDIYGRWVAAEGIVYCDFDKSRHVIKSIDGINFVKYFCGVDWGYEHYGVITLIGKSDEGKYYLLRETARKHKEIEFWLDEAKEIKEKYGNIFFYCDSARPEYVKKFQQAGLRAVNADKAVLSGIECVARLFKTDSLFIYAPAKTGGSGEAERFFEEVYMYVWNSKTGEPIKQFDDVLDSIRYAIYTEKTRGIERIKNKADYGLF